MKEKIVYALGYFDGVHKGHQALLQACCQMAQQTGGQTGVVTFLGHPDQVIRGIPTPLINTAPDRHQLLRRWVSRVVELPFDRALMEMPWQEFFSLLRTEYHACGLVCGDDFRFGRRGEGNAQKLQEACREAGIPCQVVAEQLLEGVRISSTHIRSLLEAGRLEEANRFLGHPHLLSGTVISGHRLGRTLGIPTANLAYPQELLQLPFGVYACRATVQGQSLVAVTNIGTRPTVGGHRITVEPWLLDFSGDLYGQALSLEFFAFLRPEQKFGSLEALKEQIHRDAIKAQELVP